MAFQIVSTRNGVSPITGSYRDDLAQGDLVGLALSSMVGVTQVRWELRGRPEGSAAGGAGPEPVLLANAPTASFTVDTDAGSFRLDGSYTVQATINPGSPGEFRVTAILARVSGLTIPGPSSTIRTLRKLGGFEALEDVSVTTVLQGWAMEMNRWLELVREDVTGGSSDHGTLAGAYSHGASSSDQTLVLHDALGGGVIIDATQGDFTGASALRVNTVAGGPVVIDRATGRVGIGIAAPLQAVHAKGATPALRLDRTGGVALDVANVGDEIQFLNGATVLGKFEPTGGLRADFGVGIGTAPATNPVLALGDGAGVPVSASGTARFRYNSGNGHAEWSENGGPWTPFQAPFSAYQTIDANGTPLTQRAILNFSADLPAVDNSGATRTDVSLANAGAGAGTYGGTGIASITLDAKGRVTAAAAASYLATGAHAATSVVGNPTGSPASLADIAATVDGQFLGRAGGALVWGGVPYSSLTGVPAFFYQTVDAAGTPLTQRPSLNVVAPLTAVDNSGATRTDVSLAIDGSLAVSGGNLQRSALTGDIIAGAGSNSTSFRTGTTTSVLGVAGGAAILADIAATIDGTVLRRAGGAVGFGTVPSGSVTGPATAVGFFDGTGLLAGDAAQFSWDDTAHHLTIGTTPVPTHWTPPGSGAMSPVLISQTSGSGTAQDAFFGGSYDGSGANPYGLLVRVGTSGSSPTVRTLGLYLVGVRNDNITGKNVFSLGLANGDTSAVQNFMQFAPANTSLDNWVGWQANRYTFRSALGSGSSSPSWKQFTANITTNAGLDATWSSDPGDVISFRSGSFKSQVGGNNTLATGFNYFSIYAPNYETVPGPSNAITNAATLMVSGPPTGNALTGGDSPIPITNAYALWLQGGNTTMSARLDGGLLINGQASTALQISTFGAGHLQTNGSGVVSVDTTPFYGTIEEVGTPLTQRSILNFDGTVVAADSASPARTNVGLPNVGPGAGTIGSNGIASVTLDAQGRVTAVTTGVYGFYQTVKNSAGTAQTQRANLKFLADFTVADSAPDTTVALVSQGGFTAGSFTSANVTVNQAGIITAITNGGGVAFYQTFEANGTSVTQRGAVSFSADFGVVDNSGSARTDVSLANAGAGAGAYGGAGIKGLSLDAKGRVTAVTTATYLVGTGAAPGTFNNITFNGDGLVLGGSNVAYLTSAFYQTVAEAGSSLAQRSILNFDGTVVASDSASPARTNVGLPNVGPGAGLHGGFGISGIVLDTQGRVSSVNTATYQPAITWPTGVLEGSSGSLTSYSTTANRVLLGTSGGGVTDLATLTYAAGNLNVGNSVKFSGLAGDSLLGTDSASFGATVTLGGDVSSSGLTVNVNAIHETSGPTKLTIGAIPDSSPDSTTLIRPAGTSNIIGVATKAMLTGLQPWSYNAYWQFFIESGAPVTWLNFNQSSATAVEFPPNFAATTAFLNVNLITPPDANTLAVYITRNGTTIQNIGFSSGSAAGVYTASVAVSGGSTNDTYGIAYAATGSMTPAFTASIYLR